MTRAGRPTQTTPDAWAQGALDEIEQVGVPGLSVQAVARRLGVSKGGAYHHFADRRELLRAALDRWERLHVDDLVARFSAIDDPRDRIERLMHYALLEIEPTVISQLLAAADDPDVAAVLARSAEKRLRLLEGALRELGLPAAAARDRATLTYAAYLGHAELLRHVPDRVGGPARARAYLRELLTLLLGS